MHSIPDNRATSGPPVTLAISLLSYIKSGVMYVGPINSHLLLVAGVYHSDFNNNSLCVPRPRNVDLVIEISLSFCVYYKCRLKIYLLMYL